MLMTCPHCGKSLEVPAAMLGRKGRCPGCASILDFPSPGGSTTSEMTTLPRARRLGDLIIASVLAILIHLALIPLLAPSKAEKPPETQTTEIEVKIVPPPEPEKLENVGKSEDKLELAGTPEPGSAGGDEFTTPNVDVIPTAPTEANTVDLPQAPSGSFGSGDGTGVSMEFSKGVGGGGGAGTTANFMGTSARGNRFCIIADRSGSMSGQKMEYVKKEILKTLSEMRGGQVNVMFFDSVADPMPISKPWLPKAEVNRLTGWINGIFGRGGTEPLSAFQIAFGLNPRPDVIFFMTDGIFAPTVPAQVAAMNRVEKGKKVVIHTIAFVDKSGEKLLQQIARDSGGTYRYVPFRP